MKAGAKYFLLFSLLGLGLQSVEARRREVKKEVQQLAFVNCHDGDTCKAKNSAGLLYTLRFLGLDAPEVGKANRKLASARHGQVYGTEARDYLRSRVLGKTLKVEIQGSDVYHRSLAIVFDENGKSINEEMIEKGFAFAYRGKGQKKEITVWAERAEALARKKRLGMWALAESPEDPAVYRRRNR